MKAYKGIAAILLTMIAALSILASGASAKAYQANISPGPSIASVSQQVDYQKLPGFPAFKVVGGSFYQENSDGTYSLMQQPVFVLNDGGTFVALMPGMFMHTGNGIYSQVTGGLFVRASDGSYVPADSGIYSLQNGTYSPVNVNSAFWDNSGVFPLGNNYVKVNGAYNLIDNNFYVQLSDGTYQQATPASLLVRDSTGNYDPVSVGFFTLASDGTYVPLYLGGSFTIGTDRYSFVDVDDALGAQAYYRTIDGTTLPAESTPLYVQSSDGTYSLLPMATGLYQASSGSHEEGQDMFVFGDLDNGFLGLHNQTLYVFVNGTYVPLENGFFTQNPDGSFSKAPGHFWEAA